MNCTHTQMDIYIYIYTQKKSQDTWKNNYKWNLKPFQHTHTHTHTHTQTYQISKGNKG